MCVYLSLSLSISLSIHIYIYISLGAAHVLVAPHGRGHQPDQQGHPELKIARKGTNGAIMQ